MENDRLALPLGFMARKVFAGPYRLKPKEMFGVCLLEETPRGAEVGLHLPIPDFNIPQDDEQVYRMLRILLRKLARGEAIYVGCMGGRGRTGIVLALLAKCLGIFRPIEYVREHYNGHAVETEAQEAYVNSFNVFPLLPYVWLAWVTATCIDAYDPYGVI